MNNRKKSVKSPDWNKKTIITQKGTGAAKFYSKRLLYQESRVWGVFLYKPQQGTNSNLIRPLIPSNSDSSSCLFSKLQISLCSLNSSRLLLLAQIGVHSLSKNTLPTFIVSIAIVEEEIKDIRSLKYANFQLYYLQGKNLSYVFNLQAIKMQFSTVLLRYSIRKQHKETWDFPNVLPEAYKRKEINDKKIISFLSRKRKDAGFLWKKDQSLNIKTIKDCPTPSLFSNKIKLYIQSFNKQEIKTQYQPSELLNDSESRKRNVGMEKTINLTPKQPNKILRKQKVTFVV